MPQKPMRAAPHQPSDTSSLADAPQGPDVPDREAGRVRRVLMTVAMLVDQPGLSASAAAQRLNLPRSTTHRLLSMLRDAGYARQARDGGFLPGIELHRLAGRLGRELPYAQLAQPALDRLSEALEETSILAVLSRQSLRMYYAATASPRDPMRYNLELNRPESLVWGATGRAVLAHLPDDLVEAAIAENPSAPASGEALDPAALRQDLADIRRSGYALTVSHRTRGAVGLAVPVFDAQGLVMGDVGLLIPEFRFGKHALEQLVEQLQGAALALSRLF